jgi:3-oxoadipate enol-lactonase
MTSTKCVMRWLGALGSMLGTGLILQACVSTPAAGAEPVASPDPVALGSPQRLQTSFGSLAYWDIGQGPRTLVLWPSILSDHRIYAEQIARWRASYRLIVIDGPGHGASGPASGPFSMAECAQAVAQVLDKAGVQRAAVVGTSWGGLVAGEFALAYPRRSVGIAMLNTPFYVAPEGPGFADRFIVWGARWMPGNSLYRNGVERAFFLPATRERGGPVLEAFAQQLRDADGAALSAAVASVLIHRDALAPKLPRINTPALVIAGAQDGMYPMALMRSAAESLPQGELVVVESGHIAVVDAPQATSEAVERFLQRLPW